MDHRFYVYVLFDWQGIPRYVGKGTGNRWTEHERKTDPINLLKNDFIERTWSMLGEVPKVKVAEHLGTAEALATEIVLIAVIGRIDLGTGPLVNMTDGGEGMLNPSEAYRADAAERFGRVVKAWWDSHPEAKEVLAERNRARAGIPHTAEHNAKISAGGRGIPKSAEWKAQESARRLGKPLPEEWRAALRKPKSEEGRANMAAAARTRKPSRHPRQSLAMRALWEDPEYRAKVLAARRNSKANREQVTME